MGAMRSAAAGTAKAWLHTDTGALQQQPLPLHLSGSCTAAAPRFCHHPLAHLDGERPDRCRLALSSSPPLTPCTCHAATAAPPPPFVACGDRHPTPTLIVSSLISAVLPSAHASRLVRSAAAQASFWRRSSAPQPSLSAAMVLSRLASLSCKRGAREERGASASSG